MLPMNCTKRPDEGIIRVAMVLGSQLLPSRYCSEGVDASSAKESPSEASYTLCIIGIEIGSSVQQDVAEQLDLLLAPWYSLAKLADEDLGRRENRSAFRRLKEKLREITAMPYSKLLRIDDDKSEDQASVPAEGTKSKPASKRHKKRLKPSR